MGKCTLTSQVVFPAGLSLGLGLTLHVDTDSEAFPGGSYLMLSSPQPGGADAEHLSLDYSLLLPSKCLLGSLIL